MKDLIKGLIKIFIVLAIIVGIVYGIYKVVFDCNRIDIAFDRQFTLKKMDYAKVGKEAIVKLIKIEDYRCKDADCKGEGELEYKILVINDHKYEYVTLGSAATTQKNIEKLGYTISIVEVEDDDSVTLKLVRMEEDDSY